MAQPAQVTAAEISRLAGVTRATVSNWRRRHPDFPAPSGGTEASPAYDLVEVRAWLDARGQLPVGSPADDLRTALRAAAVSDPAHRSRLLPAVVAASHIADTDLEKATELPDDRLSTWVRRQARSYATGIPGTGDPVYHPGEADLLRTLLRCVAAEGAVRTLEVLAEGDLNDTKATSVYQTPEPVAELMADLLAGRDEAYPNRVFDPACGDGNLLLAAAARGARELSGQDIAPPLAAQAAARLAIAAENRAPGTHAAEQTRTEIRVGDSMHADAFPSLVADAVLCAPPYGQRNWGHDELAYDPRWIFGLPPRNEPELAWLQHCLAHLDPAGRAALLMPPAAAERPSGRRIRAELIRSGALRAVVALPAGVAQPLHIALQIWLLQRPNPQAQLPQSVLFVDAADGHRAADTPAGRTDWPQLRETVLTAWRDFDRRPDSFDPVPGASRAVPVIDLLDEAVDLTPARHVRAVPVPAKPDELADLATELGGRLRTAADELIGLTGGQSWPPAGATPISWRTATVADLLRGEALTLLRAPRRPAAGAVDGEPTGEEITLQAGDVILPELLQGAAGSARVAEAGDAGQPLGRQLVLLRPDPTRLDPWFLAGFLAAEDNLSAASFGSTVVRVDPRRLRIPLLPLTEQRHYGRAFRHLNAVRAAADSTARLAEETARTLSAGLTGGALLPPTVEGNH
ncbi:N-6 DNA methylase [Solwaraspora sp. WMMD1047]|uniref:N-6 DNA methylase n=1 Tax=Solwaraspora sp. WMMD1047 TaxID=3016102 RepID=UPI002417ED01|nr:N-6 DNA methylase [Solwaraspora sp. WMMD1047]MDG4829332.1 N-6 DNA methylase [Solwaraspora sp. WMMD1047]